MSQPLVIITHTLPNGWITSLANRVKIIQGPEDATTLDPALEQFLPEADGILCLLTIPIRQDLLDRMARLRVVSNMAVGFDNIDVTQCTARGIPVGNTPGVLTEPTADLTMALLLSAARRLPQAASDASQGRWHTWRPAGWLGSDLFGSKIGIIGMGKIGKAVAERARGFGLKILYTDKNKRLDIEESLDAVHLPLARVISESDFISLHVPLTSETKKMINTATLRMMKPNAILVNAARGQIIDTQALVQALQEGWIAGAALDVTDPEPLPRDHPLYKLQNCLIVPHIGSATYNVRKRMAEIACENLLAGLENRRLPFCVNPEVYPLSNNRETDI